MTATIGSPGAFAKSGITGFGNICRKEPSIGHRAQGGGLEGAGWRSPCGAPSRVGRAGQGTGPVPGGQDRAQREGGGEEAPSRGGGDFTLWEAEDALPGCGRGRGAWAWDGLRYP